MGSSFENLALSLIKLQSAVDKLRHNPTEDELQANTDSGCRLVCMRMDCVNTNYHATPQAPFEHLKQLMEEAIQLIRPYDEVPMEIGIQMRANPYRTSIERRLKSLLEVVELYPLRDFASTSIFSEEDEERALEDSGFSFDLDDDSGILLDIDPDDSGINLEDED